MSLIHSILQLNVIFSTTKRYDSLQTYDNKLCLTQTIKTKNVV